MKRQTSRATPIVKKGLEMDSRLRFINAYEAGRVSELTRAGYVLGDHAGAFPIVHEGDTAIVIRMEHESGDVRALRIPRDHTLGTDWARQYHDFALRIPPDLTDVFPAYISMLDGGITLVGRQLPALTMEWLSGPTLQQAVARAAATANTRVLAALQDAFRDLWLRLREASVTHGDLSPDNLILRETGDLACVDLDTAQWPGRRMRREVADVAPAYRHPGRGATAAHQDAFSALVIYASIAALTDDPSLRNEYGDAASIHGGALIFGSWDLAEPVTSRTFDQVRERVSPPTCTILSLLARACRQEPYRASELCAEAFGLATPLPAAPDDDAPAQPPAGQDLSGVINRLRTELGAGAGQGFAHSWPETPTTAAAPAPAPEPIPETPDLSGPRLERENDVIQRLTTQIHDAARHKQDADVVRLATVLEQRHLPVDPATRAMVRAARERERVSHELQRAILAQDNIALANLAVSGDLSLLDDPDRAALSRVVQAIEWPGLKRAIEADDDVLILQWYDADVFDASPVVPAALKQRIELARQRQIWLEDVRVALRQRTPGSLSMLLQNEPEGGLAHLSAGERRRALQQVQRQAAIDDLQAALATASHDRILDALMTVERVGARIEDRQTWTAVQNVIERATLLDQIAQAARSSPPDDLRLASLLPIAEQFGLAHDPQLSDDLAWDALQQIVLRGAQVRRIRAAISRGDDRLIRQAAQPDPTGALDQLTPEERTRVQQALARKLIRPAPRPRS